METRAPLVLQTGASIYTKPSLPYLLADYGFEDEDTCKLKKKGKERKQQQQLLKKQKANKSQSFDTTEDERDLEKEKQREEYYEQMVKDLHRLRDYYYRQYTGMLAEKVERQRKEMKERDEEIRKKRQQREENEIKLSQRVKKKIERHTLETTPLTVPIPKTNLYHIVGLEGKLRREGKIKNMSDYNKFREEISQPQIFYNYFKKSREPVKSSTSTEYTSSHIDSSSDVFPLASEPEIDEMPSFQRKQRSLSRISEAHEISRQNRRTDSWAITQQYPSIYRSRKSLGNVAKQKSEYQQDLNKRFPKLEMPKLNCFTMNLAKKPLDPEEVQQQLELRAKEKQRKRAIRANIKMYQLAMSNAAVTARIFHQHEDMDMLLYGPDLCDVIADNHWMQAYGLREFDQDIDQDQTPEAVNPSQIPEWSMQSPPIPNTGQDKSLTSAQLDSADGLGGNLVRLTKSSAKSKKSLLSDEKLSPLPLTIDEIESNCNIMEAKTLSTLWNNYLRSGKSIGQ